MGLDGNALHLIKLLAENRIQDAKEQALVCCESDNTKKNEGKCRYFTQLLKNGSIKSFEVPPNLTGVLQMQDMSKFNENRYYLGKERTELFNKIKRNTEVVTKLLEYDIHYMNSTLIYGEAGTGKTEFAKYVAYQLGLPFAYISFSGLIDSLMGKTSQNIQRIFDFCKGQKCVLMLDEIDCIGLKRGNDGGCDGELGRTTISLMQALDTLVDGQIIIAATNRRDRLDNALLRRFKKQEKFVRFEEKEQLAMINAFMTSVDEKFLTEECIEYAKASHTQDECVSFLIDKIVENL